MVTLLEKNYPELLTREVPRTIEDLELNPQNYRGFPSPSDWEDEVLYFLMLDRFSDGNEKNYMDNENNMVKHGSTDKYELHNNSNAVNNESNAQHWRENGELFVGGNLRGLQSKLGYLKRLGITAIWLSPCFKQVKHDKKSYHGYGIQNFLDVDERFGTRKELRELVNTAHSMGIRVIMDIILNHTGDVFAYDPSGYRHGKRTPWDGNFYPVAGLKNKEGKIAYEFGRPDMNTGWPDDKVWPVELQEPGTFTAKGNISNWNHYPEYIEGDFCSLKDINLGYGDTDHFVPSKALRTLCEAYKYWILLADIDGFRIDTVKHMHPGAVRFFTNVIKEYAQSIGKENFYLIGEITGGREHAYNIVETTGLDAALGIDDVQNKLEYMVKGYSNPEEYFNLFRNSIYLQKNSHTWFKDKIITMFDDHDAVTQGQYKTRFCSRENGNMFILNALALNVTTLGIPCIYYGSEQDFDGQGDHDKYIREAMFGGKFGAFRSQNAHFFKEDTRTYSELSRILELRKEHMPLRRGRQYLRSISEDGHNFFIPQKMGNEMRSVVAWSRIFNNEEILVAMNTDMYNSRSAWVTIDNNINMVGQEYTCLYSSDNKQIHNHTPVTGRNGKSLYLNVPAAGFVIYRKK